MFLTAVVAVLLLLESGCGQEEACPQTKLCAESYCNSCYTKCADTSSHPLVLNGSEVVEGVLLKTFQQKDDYCDCCQPTFVPYISEGEPCIATTANYDLQNKGLCGPGLTCNKKESVCRPIDSDCTRAQQKYNDMLASGDLGMDMSKPECDADGYWAPVQCSFTGVCRCVDKLTGRPIFGMDENLAAARESGMDCSCSREMEVLREMSCSMMVHYQGNTDIQIKSYQERYLSCLAGTASYWPGHLRCLPNGNYDPAQCHTQQLEDDVPFDLDEECFCLNPTNLTLASDRVILSLASTVLPCHAPVTDLYYADYYRPCEKAWHENRKMEAEALAKGASFLSGMWLGECTPDGFYALVQRQRDNPALGYCSDRLGERIENFAGNYEDMDCLCAQVWRYTDSLDYRPRCTENGSFAPAQCRFSHCYCVNEYGQQLGQEEDYINFDPASCTVYSIARGT